MKVCSNNLSYITIDSCVHSYDDTIENLAHSTTIRRQKEEAKQFYEDNLQFKFRPDINKKNG